MISKANDNKKLKFGAVWLWCIGKGYEQKENKESFLDATFSEGEKQLVLFSNLAKLLVSCFLAQKRQKKVQYIYIVIDDDSKYQSLKKLVPEFCGFFCNSNAFGLGMVTQIKRQAAFISKECEK